MQYISTNHKTEPVNVVTAIAASHAADGGMYWPESLPVIPRAFFNNFAEMTFPEIAYVIADRLFGDVLHAVEIKKIVDGSFNFPVPIVQVADNLWSLELFHGPTLAFKDFGARFMARMLRLFLEKGKVQAGTDGKLHVLVATTGNTGSATANAFAGIPGVEVYVLFPRGVVSRQLEAQFTTLGGNVHPLEVQGTIDDCHALVAQAFSDPTIAGRLALTSANSVNIVRLLPQTFYYFYAMSRMPQLAGPHTPVTVAVPAGNLGNLTAAVAAKKMGLHIGRIIAAENTNSYLTELLREGVEPGPARAIPTLSYAADKSTPTNLPRLRQVCGAQSDIRPLREAVSAISLSDADVIEGVNHCLDNHRYIIDPHTALAYQALRRTLPDGYAGLMLATAHPAKSLTAMNAITGRAMDLPLQLTKFMSDRDYRIPIMPTYAALQKILLENAG